MFISVLVTLLFLLAPPASAQSTTAGGSLPSPLPPTTPSILVEASGSVAQCTQLNITWRYANVDNEGLVFLNLRFFSLSRQTDDSDANMTIGTNVALTQGTYSWPKVDAPVGQFVVIAVSATPGANTTLQDQSDTVNVIAGTDLSCLTHGGASTSSLSTPSPSPTVVPAPPSSEGSSGLSTGGIAGVVVGPLLALICAVIAFLAWRKRKSSSQEGFGSRRGKWGGLTSVDSRNALGPDYGGAGPAVGAGVAATNAAFAYSRPRNDSLAKVNPEESDSLEEEKLRNVAAARPPVDGLDTVPPLLSYGPKPRHSASSSISTSFTHGHQPFATAPASSNYNQPNPNYSQNSLSRARASSLKAFIANSSGNVGSGTTVPIIHPPTPTDGVSGTRPYRSNSLSLPGSARESLDGATTPSPVPPHPPLPSATNTTPTPSPITPNGFNRSSSGNGPSRPTRKPVPVYEGEAMEMLNQNSYTPGSSPGTSSYLNRSQTNLGNGSTMSRGGSIGGGVTGSSPGLSRNGGGGSVGSGGVLRLAAEGDGPVHYLIPDMPPPPRRR